MTHNSRRSPSRTATSSTQEQSSVHIWNPYSSVQIYFPRTLHQHKIDAFSHITDIPSFQFTKKVPHITVIPNWISYYEFEQTGARLWENLHDFPPFEVKITRVEYFVSKLHCTLYAVPEPVLKHKDEESPLTILFQRIHELLRLRVNRRKQRAFLPHITIGRCDTEEEAKEIISRGKPLSFTCTVDRVLFCSKIHGHGGEERLRIPFGGKDKIEVINPLPPKCEQLVNVKLPPPNCSLTDEDLWKIFKDFELLKAHHNLKNGQSSGFATLLMQSVEAKQKLIEFSRANGGFPIHGGRQRIYAESFY